MIKKNLKVISLITVFCFVRFSYADKAPGETPPTSTPKNTGTIVALTATGLIVAGGIVYLVLKGKKKEETSVRIIEDKGKKPILLVFQFEEKNYDAKVKKSGETLQKQVVSVLKKSKGFELVESPSSLEANFVINGTATVYVTFSQGELEVTKLGTGELIISKTISWIDEKELKEKVVQFVNELLDKTHKIK